MSQKKNRVGETKIMHNGLQATIIEYRNSKDIDVGFENGTIRTNMTYHAFCERHIRCKESVHHENVIIKMMNNGLKAEVIAYRGYQDIDVRFEDGIIVKTTYQRFKLGNIPHPNIKYKSGISFQEFAIYYYLRHLGFKKIEHGEWKSLGFGNMELDFYNDEYKVAIEFDGGVHNKPVARERDILKNKKCCELGIKLFRIRHPDCIELNDLNSTDYKLSYIKKITYKLIDCKEELEDILTHNNILISADFIDFVRDKDKILIEYNNTYINCDAKARVGQVAYCPSAQQNATIIDYRDSRDCDVMFEDGTIRRSVRYDNFIGGSVGLSKRINANKCKRISVEKKLDKKPLRVGEKSIHSSGEEMEIIAYRNKEDCDIKFADGTIVYKKRYQHFKNGEIKKPQTES